MGAYNYRDWYVFRTLRFPKYLISLNVYPVLWILIIVPILKMTTGWLKDIKYARPPEYHVL